MLGGVKPRTDRLGVSRVTRCRGDGQTLPEPDPAGQYVFRMFFGICSDIAPKLLIIRPLDKIIF